MKGPTRTRASIIGGLLISNDEGHRWFKDDTYNYELPDNRRQDINVTIRLGTLLEGEKDIALGCCTA
jgi:hypothetical protein